MTLSSDFKQAVKKARKHKGPGDYVKMAEGFSLLLRDIGASNGSTPGASQAELRKSFLEEATRKMKIAAQGFIDFLSFSGGAEFKVPGAYLSTNVFLKGPAGFFIPAGQNNADQLRYFRREEDNQANYILQRLGVGLPVFAPLDGEHARVKHAKPPPLLVRVGYEDILQTAQPFFELAQAANVALELTYPNISRDGKKGVSRVHTMNHHQEIGNAHVFTDSAIVGPTPFYTNIVVALDIRKEFDAAKYPATFAELEPLRRKQYEEKQAKREVARAQAVAATSSAPLTPEEREAQRQAQIAAFQQANPKPLKRAVDASDFTVRPRGSGGFNFG